MTALALVETAEQAQALETSAVPASGTHPGILSLQPEAAWVLARRGLPHWSLRDVIAPADVDAAATDQLLRLEEALATIDQALEEAGVPWVSEMKVKPAALAWYELKTVMNSVGLRLNVLARLRAQGVARIVAFGPPSVTDDASLFWGGSMWARVLRAMAESRQLEVSWLVGPIVPRRARLGLLRRVSDALPEQVRWHASALSRAARVIGWRRAALMARSPRDPGGAPPVVLFLSPGSNLPAVIEAALADGRVCPAFPIGLKPKAFEVWHRTRTGGWQRSIRRVPRERTELECAARAGARAWEALSTSEGFRRLWDEGGLAGFPAIAGLLREFVTSTSVQLAGVWRATTNGLNQLAVRAVLAEVTGSAPVKAVMAAARQAGVPVAVYRHGVSLGYMTMEHGVSPEEYRNDVLFSDSLLCWGALDAEFFRRWHSAPAVAVGSAHLDALRRLQRSDVATRLRSGVRERLGIPPHARCAVYVLQNLAGNAIPNPHRYRLPDVEWAIECAIIEAFREFPEVVLVVRLHPDPAYPEPPVRRLVQDLGMPNVRVVRDGSMAELLAAGDLFITDYPTTMFLEMLTTDKPVLVCGQDLPPRFAPGPAVLPLWSERVLFKEDLAGFLDLLRDVLAPGAVVPPLVGDGLLRNFGTHLEDGGSARRVLVAVEALLT